MNQKRLNSMLGLGALLGMTAGCMAPRTAVVTAAPESLKTPESQVLAIAAHAIGVQIYECQAGGADPTAFAWTLKAPEAQLHYEAGKELGKHYAGPTWEANDGSKVVGEVVAHDAGPDAAAIPWLLLRAKQTSGTGVFSAVESIQRLHTAGGKAPATGCSQTYAGTEVRVAYSADYYFYKAKP
ncbi:MAG: hypothetical protein QOD56_2036 [Gammaproteobacteria bacterium]|jgi:hypothetical protein|nr:hypothetical protein [Gammaproteobacteria bacterium]